MIIRTGPSKYDTIRKCARSYSKYILPKICMLCKYDKHYEVCHIKPVSSFNYDQLLSEVNNRDNLVHLCPNCHWEFDHGLIPESKIRALIK